MGQRANICFVEGAYFKMIKLTAGGRSYSYHWHEKGINALRDRIEVMGIDSIIYSGRNTQTDEDMPDSAVAARIARLAEII